MKYIVDIDDFEPLFKVDSIGVFGIGKSVSDSDNDHSWSRIKSIEEFEELNSDYINEHYGQLQDDAYQRGLAEGKKAFGLLDAERDSEYQRGLDDAWETAKKVVLSPKEGGMSTPTLFKIFRRGSVQHVFRNYSASQVIEKLKAYEEKQKADDEIKVGDEVRRKSAPENERGGIVTKDWENSYFIMWTDGSSGQWDKDRVVKTGRHFDIASILKEMQS